MAVSAILTVACFGHHPKQVPIRTVAVPATLTVVASARDDRADDVGLHGHAA